jgi:hypothetical protein
MQGIGYSWLDFEEMRMPKPVAENMTEQQRRWFDSVRSGLKEQTGKSLAEWVAIARNCPESKPRARLKWFKQTHGLLQNRAMYVLNEAFPPPVGWDQPDVLKAALWTDSASRTILEVIEGRVLALPDVIASQRKGYSAWSRKYQFAALRPIRGGMARLGLALTPEADDSLQLAKNESWSERLKGFLVLRSPGEVNKRVAALLKAAWDAS